VGPDGVGEGVGVDEELEPPPPPHDVSKEIIDVNKNNL
jgi:hypothetical protein